MVWSPYGRKASFTAVHGNPPVIVVNPASVTVAVTTPMISLSVGVTGSQPIWYQWYCNGNMISNSISSYTIDKSASGGLSVSDSTSCYVTAINIFGNVTSQSATVTVSQTANNPLFVKVSLIGDDISELGGSGTFASGTTIGMNTKGMNIINNIMSFSSWTVNSNQGVSVVQHNTTSPLSWATVTASGNSNGTITFYGQYQTQVLQSVEVVNGLGTGMVLDIVRTYSISFFFYDMMI